MVYNLPHKKALRRTSIMMTNEGTNLSLPPAISWFVYLLRCADNSLYTGITTDLDRRLNEHNGSNKGARYTRSRRPVKLVYSETLINRASASQREYAIKKLSRHAKEQLIVADDS